MGDTVIMLVNDFSSDVNAMKKFLKPELLPVLTVVLGSVGMLLRVWLLVSGIDEKGLYVQGHIADTLSYLLLAVTALAVYLCALPLKGSGDVLHLFPASATAAVGCFCAAAGVVIAAVSELAQSADMILLFSMLAGFLASACLVFTGLCRLRGHKPSYIFHAAVTIYFLLHLIARYRYWNRESQLQIFFFPLLASVLLMLCAYQRACLDAREGNRRTYVVTNQLAMFCCFLSITDRDWLFYLSMLLWTMTNLCDLTVIQFPARLRLPCNVRYCMSQLESHGYRTYAVGGCVRDALLGLTPHDYDLCTAATPEQIAQVFSDYRLIRNGEKHGTIGVVMDDQVYEITTFRAEGSYSDGRHPDWVQFVPTVRGDLARRDFTINAIAYTPKGGFADPFGGRIDLQNRVLRAVGDPNARFTEDSLRILRGIRFSLRYQLTPEEDTLKAMIALAPQMDRLAAERIFSELCGILPLVKASDLLFFRQIITQVIPELSACVDFQQHTPHHAYDVFTHTAYVTEAVGPQRSLRLAALLHDVAKPVVFTMDEKGQGHFPEHAREGARMADEILRRLKAPTALREQVVFLIDHHMSYFAPDRQLLRRRLSRYGEENCRLLLQLQKADFSGKGVSGDAIDYDAIEALLDALVQEDACLQLKDLAVNGDDLIRAGFIPGPQLGEVLKALLDQVVEETLPNEQDALLAAAEAMKQ